MYAIYTPASIGNLFEPLEHREHRPHRNGARDNEDHPCGPYRNALVEDHADEKQQVPEGRGSKPASLHKALHVGWSHFRYEREAQRRDEQLGYGEEQKSGAQGTGQE